MGRTIAETGRNEDEVPYHESNRRHGDILPTPTPNKGQPSPWSDQEDPEKIGLRTLGDGPLAPGAAGEAAQAEAEQDVVDKDVPPGVKGWLNLLGVSISSIRNKASIVTYWSGGSCEHAML